MIILINALDYKTIIRTKKLTTQFKTPLHKNGCLNMNIQMALECMAQPHWKAQTTPIEGVNLHQQTRWTIFHLLDCHYWVCCPLSEKFELYSWFVMRIYSTISCHQCPSCNKISMTTSAWWRREEFIWGVVFPACNFPLPEYKWKSHLLTLHHHIIIILTQIIIISENLTKMLKEIDCGDEKTSQQGNIAFDILC